MIVSMGVYGKVSCGCCTCRRPHFVDSEDCVMTSKRKSLSEWNEYNFKSFGRTLDIDGIKQLSGRYGRQSSNEWEQRERTSEMQDPVDRESGSLPIDRQNSPNKKKKKKWSAISARRFSFCQRLIKFCKRLRIARKLIECPSFIAVQVKCYGRDSVNI